MTRLALAFGAGLVVVELTLAVVLVTTSNHESELGGAFALAVTAGVAFMVSGLIALWRRPENRTGAYLAAVGFLWFLGALTESNHSWIYIAGFVLGGLAFVPFSALLLTHPTGRFETRFDRAFPWIVGTVLVGFELAIALVDPTRTRGARAAPTTRSRSPTRRARSGRSRRSTPSRESCSHSSRWRFSAGAGVARLGHSGALSGPC